MTHVTPPNGKCPEFPALHDKYRRLYRIGGADKGYKNKQYSRVNRLREKYGLSGSYSKAIKEKFKRYPSRNLGSSIVIDLVSH